MASRDDKLSQGRRPIARHGFTASQIAQLQRLLLDWFYVARRDLPWRRTSDPYRVWVSEIMLQQTRVAVVIPYYERFLARCPDAKALAELPEPELLALWAGLGYYYRARNLQRAAKQIVARGGFPGTFDEIRKLSGIGDYTAAAIASIAFGLPHAVVDGNVFRVLSRLLNDDSDISTLPGKRGFIVAAGEILNEAHPGDHNQALMELGATVCLPRKPQCLVCPLTGHCRARNAGTVERLPVKTKDQRAVFEERTLFRITRGAELLLWQRSPESQLMPGFWELPESTELPDAQPLIEFGSFCHSITFHRYLFRVYSATIPARLGRAQWVPLKSLESLPLSTIARKGLRLANRKIGAAAELKRNAASA